MVTSSTEPSGDSNRRFDRLTTRMRAIVQNQRSRENAWYTKYFSRFRYGSLDSGGRDGEKEPTVTHSAPDIHSRSRDSVIPDANTPKTASVVKNLVKRPPNGRSNVPLRQETKKLGLSSAPISHVNTLKQKMRELAARQYQVEAEHLLANINDQIPRSRNMDVEPPSIGAPKTTQSRARLSTMTVKGTFPPYIVLRRGKQENDMQGGNTVSLLRLLGRPKHAVSEVKQERRKALRQILESAEEYMDGVKKCDEILRALSPLPLKKYVEKWLTASSSTELSLSVHSYLDLTSNSDAEKISTSSASNLGSCSSKAAVSDISDVSTTRSGSKTPLARDILSLSKKKLRKTGLTLHSASRQQPSRNTLSMGVICPVHSCTCTLNSNQPNLHSSACPSSTAVEPVDGMLRERLFHVIPTSVSSLNCGDSKTVEVTAEVLALSPLSELSALDFFDSPVTAVVRQCVEQDNSNQVRHLLDDFVLPVVKSESPLLDANALSRAVSDDQEKTYATRPTTMAVTSADEQTTDESEQEIAPLPAITLALDRMVNCSRNRGRCSRSYCRFRLSSRVRQKLNSYIFKRKDFAFSQLMSIRKRSAERLMDQPVLPLAVAEENSVVRDMRDMSGITDQSAASLAETIPAEARGKGASGLPVPKHSCTGEQDAEQKMDPMISAVVPQNQDLVAGIANIFATLQDHVQRAENDRRLLTDFIKGSTERKPTAEKTSAVNLVAAPSAQPATPIAASRSSRILTSVLSQTTTPIESPSSRPNKAGNVLKSAYGLATDFTPGTCSLSEDSRTLPMSRSEKSQLSTVPSRLSLGGRSRRSKHRPLRHRVSTESLVLRENCVEQKSTLVSSDTMAQELASRSAKETCSTTASNISDNGQRRAEAKTTKTASSQLLSPRVPSYVAPGSAQSVDSSSDNSAVYGTPRTGFAQSLLSLSTAQSRKTVSQLKSTAIPLVSDSDAVKSEITRTQKATNGEILRKPSRQQKKTARAVNSAMKTDRMMNPAVDKRDKSIETTMFRSHQQMMLPRNNHSFYISSSSSGATSNLPGTPVSSSNSEVRVAQVSDGLLKPILNDSISETADKRVPNFVEQPKISRVHLTSVEGNTTIPAATRPTAAPRNKTSRAALSATSQKHNFDVIMALLGPDAFRVNISDSTLVDSETGLTFHPAKSDSGAIREGSEAAEETEPSRLNVHCDAERMDESELQKKLHNLKAENGTPTPLIELLEYFFFLLGLRGIQPEEDLFLPTCHVEDSMILWNAWKSKVFTVTGRATPPVDPVTDADNPTNMYAFHAIDRLFHFLTTYCNIPEWNSTAVNRATLETNGDIKALYELFHVGIIEIPADRPKFFTNDVLTNRRNLRLFIMNMFRFDADGQEECVLRQKCLLYVHLFKNNAINQPTAEQIVEYRTFLRSFRLDELTVFSKIDDIFIDITVQQWLSSHDVSLNDPTVNAEFQLLREETKRWLIQTTLINSRNTYGSLGALKTMAAKYLKGVLGNMSHEQRTFISNILQIDQDTKTLEWRTSDDFLAKVDRDGLDQAVADYIVPYRFVGGLNLPHQKAAVSKKDTDRQETFRILEDICVQESISNSLLAQQAPALPKADLKALSRTQFYKKQLKDPDIRKHLLQTRQPFPDENIDGGRRLGNNGQPELQGRTELYEKLEKYLHDRPDGDIPKNNPQRPAKTHAVRHQQKISPAASSYVTTSDASKSVSLTNRQDKQRAPQVATNYRQRGHNI